MTSPVAWLGALRRLPRQAFRRPRGGERIPVRSEWMRMPSVPWRRPELRIIDKERQVEFALSVAGAEAKSTRIFWDEEAQLMAVHARLRHEPVNVVAGDETVDWYAEVPLGSDLDGSRAEAFLADGQLTIVVPRVDSKPLTGLPLLLWTLESAHSALASAT